MWLLSDAGMKSVPIDEPSNSEPTKIAVATQIVTVLCLTAHVKSFSYKSSSLSNPLLIGEYIFVNSLLCVLSFSLFKSNEHIIGVSESADAVETTMMIQIIQPNCLNIIPAIPVIIVNGKNTAISVRVVAITATPTSLVP